MKKGNIARQCYCEKTTLPKLYKALKYNLVISILAEKTTG